MIITMNAVNRINEMETGELSNDGFTVLKFERTGNACAKIEKRTGRSPEACAERMSFIARFFDIPHVKATVIEGEVYLINSKKINIT